VRVLCVCGRCGKEEGTKKMTERVGGIRGFASQRRKKQVQWFTVSQKKININTHQNAED
jgi:hypothetical protein